MAEHRQQAVTLFTIGHSTRTVEEFIKLLKVHGITLLVDIRTIPKSRHNPQFNSDELARALGMEGIAYEHLKDLGGLRHAKKDSVNTAWENASFRGFADYMQTGDFERGLGHLMDLAEKSSTVIMCAEAVPWRCHRSLIGDALLARGVRVLDIMNEGPAKEHKLTAFARVQGTTVTYPGK